MFADADHQLEPFDFLIDGEFVRMSLEQFLLAKGISAVIILKPLLQFLFNVCMIESETAIWFYVCTLREAIFFFFFGGVRSEVSWNGNLAWELGV